MSELIRDTTEVSARMAQADRGAFAPRAGIGGGSGKRGRVILLGLGVGFAALMGFALSGQGKSHGDEDKEAAALMKDAAKTVTTDPLGNRPLAAKPVEPGRAEGLGANRADSLVDAGAADENDVLVPALGADHTGGGAGRPDRLTSEQKELEQERKKLKEEREAMRRAPVLAFGGGSHASGASLQGNARLDAGRAEGPVRGEENPLEAKLVPSGIPTIEAGHLSNRNFLITAGTQIPCILQTAIDSTLPGFTSCLVPRNVFSDNGKVVLLEKGSRVLGEFHGGLQQGQGRIFVIWNRMVTPSGVTIRLGSPAADALGRAGLGGEIETFFWKRFGSALLLSIIGDAGNVVSNKVSSSNETTNVPSRTAEVALENDIKIPPRLRAAQGSEMSIFVAKDVDFAKIYSLRVRR